MVCSHANVQRAVQVVRTEGQRAAEAAAEAEASSGSSSLRQHAWNKSERVLEGKPNFLWHVVRPEPEKSKSAVNGKWVCFCGSAFFKKRGYFSILQGTDDHG